MSPSRWNVVEPNATVRRRCERQSSFASRRDEFIVLLGPPALRKTTRADATAGSHSRLPNGLKKPKKSAGSRGLPCRPRVRDSNVGMGVAD